MIFRKTGLRFTALLAFISTAAIAGNRPNDRDVELLSQKFEQASPAETISGKWNCTIRDSRPGSPRVVPTPPDSLIFEFSALEEGMSWRPIYPNTVYFTIANRNTGYFYATFGSISKFSRLSLGPEIEAQVTMNISGENETTTANFRTRDDKLIVEFRNQKNVCGNDISQVISRFTVAALMECTPYVEPEVLPQNEFEVYEKKACCTVF